MPPPGGNRAPLNVTYGWGTPGALSGTQDITQFQVVMPLDDGNPTVLGWAGGNPPAGTGGWEVKWSRGTQGTDISYLTVSDAYSVYRAWWGNNGRVYYQTLPTNIVNPTQIGIASYTSSGIVDYPWIKVPGNQTGVALSAFLETRNPTSSETVQLLYATNFVEPFTSLGTNSTAGRTTYNFQAGGVDAGIAFNAVRLRANMTRGGSDSNSPDILSLALAYRRPFTYLRGFRMMIDLTIQAGGRKSHHLREELNTILSTTTQMPFVYRNEADADELFQVTIVPSQQGGTDRYTGVDETGTHLVTVVEAI